MTDECDTLEMWGLPAALLWVAVIHQYCVMVGGTIGNALALWCVATCTKTGLPMKLLLFTVFLPALLLCLVVMPVYGEHWAAFLTCDRISGKLLAVMAIIRNSLVLIEVITIAAIAVIRTVAIWAPHRRKLGIRGAVVLVVVTCICAILAALGLVGVVNRWVFIVIVFVTITLPILITIVAYSLMIFAIQRNKRRLVAFQQQARVTTAMDQATRAMLAVFITNLVFWLPISIFRIVDKEKRMVYLNVIFINLFCTDYLIDPLVYIWLNSDYRDKIRTCIRKIMCCSGRAPSVHQSGHEASPNCQEPQVEITHL